jgi:hypothetical protein
MTFYKTRNSIAFVFVGIAVWAGLSFINSNRTSALSVRSQTQTSESALTTSPQSTKTSLTWNFQKIGVAVSNGQLRLLLADLSPTTDYIIGVRSTDKQESTLIAGEVRFHNPQSKSPRMILQIADWPRNQISIQQGGIEISGLSQSEGSVLIYITITPGTELKVDTQSRTLARVVPANGLMIYNGAVLPQEVEGIRTLVARLQRPNPAVNTTKIIELQANRYVATPKGLATNLISLKKPRYPVSEATGEELEQVILKIRIDETGLVKEINRIKGSKAFMDAAEQAVTEWKFQPFMAEGKPITVEASVVFFFGKDGAINSPIFDEMIK